MLIRFLILLLTCAIGSSAYAGAGWICATEQATGFSFDKGSKSWMRTNFIASSKYLVTPIKEGDFGFDASASSKIVQYAVKMFEDGGVLDFCNTGVQSDVLSCQGPGEFKMNLALLRFLYTYPIG